MQTEPIYTRVSNWNEQRYCRMYSNELTCNLIDEELEEYFDNIENDVEKLDALCDVVFVSMGGLWKLGVPFLEGVPDEALGNPAEAYIPSVVLAISFSKAIRHGFMPVQEGLRSIILLMINQALHDGYTIEQFAAAMLAVCDSNDTKAVERASFDVKANINKGENYISPTAALTLIVEEMKNAQVK